jgi:hypothetical protein
MMQSAHIVSSYHHQLPNVQAGRCPKKIGWLPCEDGHPKIER